MAKQPIIALALALACGGCTSLSSTFLHRDEMNVKWKTEKLKGVPITLKVPTHLKLVVAETRYLTGKKDDNATLAFVREPLTCEPVVSLQVNHDFVYTEKIFTVDPKRPAAGTMKYTLGLDPTEQYLTTIQSELTDTTIQEISKGLERILLGVGKVRSGADLQAAAEKANVFYKEVTSIRAMRVFEIDDPMFELNIEAFLQDQFCCIQGHAVMANGSPVGQTTPSAAATPLIHQAGLLPAPPRPVVPVAGR